MEAGREPSEELLSPPQTLCRSRSSPGRAEILYLNIIACCTFGPTALVIAFSALLMPSRNISGSCVENLQKWGNLTTKDYKLLLILNIWKSFWSVILVITFKITKLTAGAVKERT